MIDFHVHGLPGIDDGVGSEEEAIELLDRLRKQGVTKVALTPHYLGRRRSVEEFLRQRAEAFARIRGRIPEGTEVRLGAEVYLGDRLTVSAEDLLKLTLERTRYLLVEFSYEGIWSDAVYESVELITSVGLIPMAAHIERYETVRKHPEAVVRLMAAGCVIQANTSAFEDRERALALKLLSRGQIHCLGSDAHNLTDRSPKFPQAKEAVVRDRGVAAWAGLEESSERIWADERIRAAAGKPVHRVLGRYL